MRFVIQVAEQASVTIENEETKELLPHGEIEKGFVVLIGVCPSDTREIADKMIEKLLKLRIFSDENGKTNLSLADVNGALLLISQFTLYADCRKGNRPSFTNAAPAVQAKELYSHIVSRCRQRGMHVEEGVFGAYMHVSLINDGPFTIILDSADFV